MKVYQAINSVQLALSKIGIEKNRTNQQGSSYKFRGIDDIYNVVSPLLAEHHLCILPRMLARNCVERVSKNGGALFYITVEAEFDLISSEDGSKHTIKTFGEAMDSGDKATNKAMSAAYKYAMIQLFAIPTEGDNDIENQTHEEKKTELKVTPVEHARTQANAVIDQAKQTSTSPKTVIEKWLNQINNTATLDRLSAAKTQAKITFQGADLEKINNAVIAREKILNTL